MCIYGAADVPVPRGASHIYEDAAGEAGIALLRASPIDGPKFGGPKPEM